jgi:hypothetical protein
MFSSLLLCARHYRIVAVPLRVLLFAAEDGLRFVLSALASTCFPPTWAIAQHRNNDFHACAAASSSS